jgi:hypothetical protein
MHAVHDAPLPWTERGSPASATVVQSPNPASHTGSRPHAVRDISGDVGTQAQWRRDCGPAASRRTESDATVLALPGTGCLPSRRTTAGATATGLRNTTRSPVAIRPGRVTVSAVRPSFPRRGPAAGRKSAAPDRDHACLAQQFQARRRGRTAAGEAGPDMRDRPGSAVPWLARIFDTTPPLAELRPYLTQDSRSYRS